MQLPSLTILLLTLLSCCAEYGFAQFGPPEPCTVATASPPELRPLDSDAAFIPNCLPGDRVQKSALSETIAQQMALCNSFCINRALSGNFALSTAQKQALPGYPVWLLATQSYLLSDQGTTTDCRVAGNINECTTNCNRFTPPFDFFNPMPGGFVMVQDCKLGCMMKFETPTSSVNSCGESCRMNCKSVACQCPQFGDGCFADAAPPCGRDCSASSCGLGCTDANTYMNSTQSYPAAANPTKAPVITRIGNGTRYMINITNSIPSGITSDLGHSTLIVRVLDRSSSTQNDSTYFVLENGFEFDLAAFTCREVEISFAVATNQMAVSDYSPSATLSLPDPLSPLPYQLNDFNYTVEQDNRPGFFQHHIIHLEWETPQNVEFATGYTISLTPLNNDRCKSATYNLANNLLTSYTIQSTTASDPPLSSCIYKIKIEVNPRFGIPAEKSTFVLSYANPTDNNAQGSCMAVFERDTGRYNINFTVTLDNIFTPAVISGIENFQTARFEINAQGNAIPGTIVSYLLPLDSSVEEGPVNLTFPFDNLPPLLGGHGYLLSVSVRWKLFFQRIPLIQVLCEIFSVTPVQPDPVESFVLTFIETILQNSQHIVTLRYNWTSPSFQGEGITGFQIWLEREPAPAVVTGGRLQEVGANNHSAETQAVFQTTADSFNLYLQIRPTSVHTLGNWSSPLIIPLYGYCPSGTFRTLSECLPCPANTNKTEVNTTICPCLPGYFRASSEGPESDCTSPPSACQYIKTKFVADQLLNVQWRRPDVTGRDDYYYVLAYDDGESVGSHSVINKSQVVSQLITDLKPATEYTITVTVVNGVSDQDKENELKRMCRLLTTTLEGVPSRPIGVRSLGNAVVWEIPLMPSGVITQYEIQFFIPSTHLSMNRFRSSKGTFYVLQDEDKLGQPQSTYFRVRGHTSAGPGEWSSALPLENDNTSTSVTTCQPCLPTPTPCAAVTTTPPAQIPQGVYFILKGEPLENNTVIALSDVEEGDGALICKTNLTSCCGTVPNRFGQFFYPAGLDVPVKRQGRGFYRNRGDQEIRLHRRSGVASPTGRFRCEIPDANMVVQNLYITLN